MLLKAGVDIPGEQGYANLNQWGEGSKVVTGITNTSTITMKSEFPLAAQPQPCS